VIATVISKTCASRSDQLFGTPPGVNLRLPTIVLQGAGKLRSLKTQEDSSNVRTVGTPD
jgi:hypothetical protein